MKTKLLIIDDDVIWCDALKARLTNSSFQVEVVYDVISGLQKAYAFHPHAVLLDLNLPGIDGRQACKRFRQVSDVPIIMLTAMDSPQHRVACLDAGADDYVMKTAPLAELVARIQAVLRRASRLPAANHDLNRQEPVLAHGDLKIDLAKHQVTANGKQVKLTPKEFSLLSILVKHKGRVLPHEFLLTQVWGSDYEDMVLLRLYISYLRRKLEKDPAHPNLIHSEWGVGYRFA